MKVGIIGDGIIGTAVAATLMKSCPSTKVTLIDDARPNKTSRAGQGYLWSIHRLDDPVGFRTSMMAKRAWIDLLDDCEQDLLQRNGSLLFSPMEDLGLREYYQRAKRKQGSHIVQGLELIPDASSHNNLLRPGMFYGLYYPDDYTCNPPQIMECLKKRFHLQTEQRTVTNLEEELTRPESNFDYLICCAGPWINELEDVGVEPVRGLLLEAKMGKRRDFGSGDGFHQEASKFTPLMEYGYGTKGIHFTLSSRDDRLLIGASREVVGFSSDGLNEVQDKIIHHANKFMVPGIIGKITQRRLGFRPACSYLDTKNERKYWIKRSDANKRIILVYGFEGQGVLYAPLAALDVKEYLDAGEKYMQRQINDC